MTGNGVRESMKILQMSQWAISSQASWEQVEGSETRPGSPNLGSIQEWTVKALERGEPFGVMI